IILSIVVEISGNYRIRVAGLEGSADPNSECSVSSAPIDIHSVRAADGGKIKDTVAIEVPDGRISNRLSRVVVGSRKLAVRNRPFERISEFKSECRPASEAELKRGTFLIRSVHGETVESARVDKPVVLVAERLGFA